MKDLKISLLEKKEMDEVRGGIVYNPCGCHCHKVQLNHYPWEQYNTEKVAVRTWGKEPMNYIHPNPYNEE